MKRFKQFILLTVMLLTFGFANAQIGEVKIESGYAMIYNEDGKFTQKSIRLDKNDVLNGFNNQYVIITKNGYVYIYDYSGKFTNNSIRLSGSDYVKNVTSTAILIVKGNLTWYYDFKGKFTNKTTRN